MTDFYYLILWKGYSKEKNIWKPSMVVLHLSKLINTFYKEHLEKSTAISLSLDSALSIAKLIISKKPRKKAKNSCIFYNLDVML